MKKRQLFSRELRWHLFKTRVSHIRWMLAEIKLIRLSIMGMFSMVYPKDDRQHKQLMAYVQAYDKAVQTLETEVVSRARKMCNIEKQ